VFNLRYHVTSLAAVFLALLIGIVVGVGLAGSGVTKEADLKLARAQRDEAQALADSKLAQVKSLQKSQAAFEIAYPAVMNGRLAGKRIAVLFVGPVDGGVVQAIERTLADAGATPPVRVVSLAVPTDAQKLDDALLGKGLQTSKYVGSDQLTKLGAALGKEFVAGGQTPLWKLLGSQLIGERSGSTRTRADGVVVVRTAKAQAGDTARFLRGFYGALASGDSPAVGVELSGHTPSSVDALHDRGLATVDDLDLPTGRAALALLLAGAAPGRYGTADDDDAILPPVPSG
jgi:Copper transport outer membrane protein, MctB